MTWRTTIETLGDLREHDMSLTWYCARHDCGRMLSLTLDRAIEMFGANQVYINWLPPGVICRECGSRRIEMRVAAVPNGYALPGRHVASDIREKKPQ